MTQKLSSSSGQQSTPPPYRQPQSHTSDTAPQGEVQDSGRSLGIIGLIVGLVVAAPVGLILCIIALYQSKRAKVSNTPAVIGIILSSIIILLWLFLFLIFVLFIFSAADPVTPPRTYLSA